MSQDITAPLRGGPGSPSNASQTQWADADHALDAAAVPELPVSTAWPLTLLPTTVLPAGPQAARAARAHISRLSDDWPTDALDMATLLTSELVTNAVLHGEGDVELTVRGADGAVRVEVTDRNPDMQPRSGGPDSRPTLDGGHGLMIVAGIADDWGTSRTDEGKTVWFNLRHTPEIASRSPFGVVR